MNQRYRNAVNFANNIFQHVTYNELRQYSSEYQRTKKDNLKSYHDSYIKYKKSLKIINNINKTTCTGCSNCRRRNVRLIPTLSTCVKPRKRFNHIVDRRNRTLNLCAECKRYLVTDTDSPSFSWPSYIWYVLTNEEIHHAYGPYIWRFIPIKWRKWWLDSVKNEFFGVFSNVTIQEPSSVFEEKTFEHIDWNRKIQRYHLPSMAEACNEYLRPTVKCPWGCTDMPHRTGTIAIDIVFQRYLKKVRLKPMMSVKQFSLNKMISAREDFLPREGFEEYLIFHPKWKVAPTIVIVRDIGPCILTCRDHCKGEKKFAIHQCRWKHNLPAPRTDQVCQAVVNPRQLKPVQANKFSTTYQMFHQTGSFAGIDTCTHTTYGHYDIQSKLLFEAEARSIANRPDINNHMSLLVEENQMSECVAESKRDFARQYSENINYEDYTYGSTYVPIEASIIIQRENEDRTVEADILDLQTNTTETIKYNKFWSSAIYPCQTMTKEGTMFPTIPQLRSQRTNTKTIWTLATVISRVEALWRNIEKVPLITSRWHGWMLSYLTAKCFNQGGRKQAHTDPFKINKIKVDKLVEKIGEWELYDYFTDTPHVKYHDISESSYISLPTENDTTNVIIVDKFCTTDYTLHKTISINNEEYDLVTVVGTMDTTGVKWNGFVYSRHHGENFKHWWHNEKTDKYPIVTEHLPRSLPSDHTYTLIYVKKENLEMNKIKDEIMESIGGQTNVRCEEHKLPLIKSTNTCSSCNCGRREYLTCSNINCTVNLCKPCYETKDKNSTEYINNSNNNREDSNNMDTEYSRNEYDDEEDSNSDDDETIESMTPRRYNSDNDDESIESMTPRRYNSTDNDSDDESVESVTPRNENDIHGEDNFDDFFMHSIDDDRSVGSEEEQFQSMINTSDVIPTTNCGAETYEIEQTTEYGGSSGKYTISGHVILNQCGSLLTRKKHQIKGGTYQKHMLQKIHSTCKGKCVPLHYTEAVLYPSIHYATAPDKFSIPGCIPAGLLTDKDSSCRFDTIDRHIRSRLTNNSSATSSSPAYISYLYDVLTNKTACHEDTRLILNRGLTVQEDEKGTGIGVRGKSDSPLLQSVDSKRMVRNLCSSQKYHSWDHFLTFTCNMKKHFGTAPIKNWFDSGEWKDYFPDFYKLQDFEQEEIIKSVQQSMAPVLMRVWEETYLLLVEYLQKSPSSPFKHQRAIFSRKEYQQFRGNLSHSHVMIELDWKKMTDEEIEFVDDLIRASVCDIVRADEAKEYVKEGIIGHPSDIKMIHDDGETYLGHVCSDSCLVRMPDGSLRCRKLDNAKISPDNTKHMFLPLPNDYSVQCLKILEEVGLTEKLDIDDDGNVKEFKSNLPFFHPERHIPPTNPTFDVNISPVVGYLFANCRSMQNVQRIKGSGGCSKYICKYVAKMDEQNYIVVEIDGKGRLVSKGSYLHNTKIASSKMGEETKKKENNNYKKPQGRCISLIEMIHTMLHYPEVVKDIDFVQVPTTPLESRPGISINSDVERDTNKEYVCTTVYNNRNENNTLPEWRKFTESQKLIMDDTKLSKLSIDKITQFSLRPPELMKVFDNPGDYYRWFYTKNKKVKKTDLSDLIVDDVTKTSWIDGLQRQVKVRTKALKEIEKWCEKIINDDNIDMEDDNEPKTIMINLFRRIIRVNNGEESDEEFCDHVKKNLLHDENMHLPIPVFSCINPTMGSQFIYHIMLSMGRFSTEFDISVSDTIRECLRKCKLIGTETDNESLRKYARKLLRRYIEEQLQYYPNSQRVLDSWIIAAYDMFKSVILRNEIPITELPPSLLANLWNAQEEDILEYSDSLRKSLIEAAKKEINDTENNYNIPAKADLLQATKENALDWNPISNFKYIEGRSRESYNEQRHAIVECVKSIDKHANIFNSTSYTKNSGIRGFPGAGKTWCMMYLALYAASKGLKCVTSAMMCNRALQLGGVHAHQLFLLPTEEHLTPHRKAELAIAKLLRTPKKLNLLRTLDVLFFDEMGQVSAEMLNIFDMILREVRNTNVYMGGVHLIFSMDHTQIQPVKGRPFLTSCNVLPCFKMVELQESVRASGDMTFQRIQQIARYSHKRLKKEPHLIEEFKRLCSDHLTFVPTWDDDKIGPRTMRLYSKKIPAREAGRNFVERVRRLYNHNNIREKVSEDLEKSRYSHRDWNDASTETTQKLEQKLKEPRELIFFKGAIYEITFNKEGEFAHGQVAILHDLPTIEQLNNWRKIKVLVAPPGHKDFDFDENTTKEEFLQKGFKEIEIGTSPVRTQNLGQTVQATRKQYGLKHRVTSTIHAAMGDTLPSMATEISKTNSEYKMWDKGQLIVILSRTKKASDTIFVGDKNGTIQALTHLLTTKTQWTDYMEEVLDIITVKNEKEKDQNQNSLTQKNFPYRPKDFTLPACNTGYVYMIVSIKDKWYHDIHTTSTLRTSINNHNKGTFTSETQPSSKRPYVLLAFICGFERNIEMMKQIRQKWKERLYTLQRTGNENILDWAACGEDVIKDEQSLTFVPLFASDNNNDST